MEDSTDSQENNASSVEAQKEKIPYPKSVIFIVSNEFCERFSYYGMRTILTLYLINILGFSDQDSTVTYHTFSCLVYFFPIFGAILSDSYIGKFNTIFFVSIIYAAGSVLLALTATGPLHIPQVAFSLIGLLLIAIGSGGIKPCVSAFGGDQFKVPEQEIQLATFFQFYYFAINSGSLISTFLTPVLRNDVHCFDLDSCFSLAFAVPGVLMIISIIVFGLGKPFYKIKKPEGNIMVDVAKCIWHGMTQNIKSDNKVDHWLDHSERKFGAKLVAEVKAVLKVLVIFIPLPIFWALYDQQGSVWTIQATKMDGDLGFYTILPDQMQVVNPVLILAFIPIFSYLIYPAFDKCNFLKTPLQRMICGGFLAAVAFGVSAVISTVIENGQVSLPGSDNVQLRIYNPTYCSYNITSNSAQLEDFNVNLDSFKAYQSDDLDFWNMENVTFYFKSSDCVTTQGVFELESESSYALWVLDNKVYLMEDEIDTLATTNPILRTLSTLGGQTTYESLSNDDYLKIDSTDFDQYNFTQGDYSINGNGSYSFDSGVVYTVLIGEEGVQLIKASEATTINLLWQLPQYFIITVAEILFTITGLSFAYSQAPVTMKSVLTACFLLTDAIGNVIIIIIESLGIFDRQSYDFFLYTGLMVLDMLLFAYLASKYVYVKPVGSEENSVDDTEVELETKKSSNGIDNPSFTKGDENEKDNDSVNNNDNNNTTQD